MNETRGLEQTEQEATRRMLAGLLAQRRLGFFDRLAARAEWRLGRWNEYWTKLSRRGRRALGRRLAPALLGASLLATLVVAAAPVSAAGITADGTVCTIIEAIQSAESDTAVGGCASGGGNDVITMTADATLTAAQGYYGYADTGLPPVTTTITIEGNGHAITRDGSAPDFRILVVDSSGDLTLNEVTISGGRLTGFTPGGGIYNKGLLTLNDSVVSGNYAYFSGGGIYNYRTLALNSSEVSYNSSMRNGGGIQGGFYGTTLTDSTISHNTAGRGGGICVTGELELINSTVSENEAGAGGGICHFRGHLTLTDSTVSNNTAAGYGGGIEKRYGNMKVVRSTISGNSAGAGGGIHSKFAALTEIINSTVSGNSATGKGGGVYSLADSNIDLLSTTISDNSAGAEGGGFYHNSVADVNNSLISGNTAGGAGDEVYNKSSYMFFREYYTVFGHSGLTTAAAIAGFAPNGSNVTATSDGTDPTPLPGILEPLADNGGPTLTHALVTGSPAIDFVVSSHCSPYSILDGIDQRGAPRNFDGNGSSSSFECDAGAYEFGATVPNPMLYVSPRKAGTVSGIKVKPQDIVAQDLTTGDWAMHFDGSDVGVTRPLAAFTHLSDGSLLLAFSGNLNLPGLNGVTTNDVVRFVPTSPGDATAGVFEWYIDGSDVGLTGSAEKIDALDALADGRLLISPAGNAQVPLGGGRQQAAKDEDLLAFSPTATGPNSAGMWALHFDGSTVPGLAVEDVVGAHLDESTGDFYLAVINGFTIGGVSGNGKDILKLSPSGGGFAVTRFWRGSDNGFNLDISGLDMP